jgi:hypothetical protein
MAAHVGGLMFVWLIDRTWSIAHEVICGTTRCGTLIRYYFWNGCFLITQTRLMPTLALCVVKPTCTAVRIASFGLTLELSATGTRTRPGAIALTMIAASTDDNLLAAKGTQKEPGTGEHRHKMPMSAGFNLC